MKQFILASIVSFFLHVFVIILFFYLWQILIPHEAPLAGGGGGVSIEIIGESDGPSNQPEKKNQAQPPAIPPERGLTQTQPQQPTQSGSPRVLSQGSGTGPGPAGPGSGSDNGKNDLLAEIRARIEKAKRYPAIARQMNIQGVSVVHFEIDPSGQPQSISLKNSSGSSLLDDEALATIHRAAPFPIYEDPLEVGIRFEIVP